MAKQGRTRVELETVRKATRQRQTGPARHAQIEAGKDLVISFKKLSQHQLGPTIAALQNACRVLKEAAKRGVTMLAEALEDFTVKPHSDTNGVSGVPHVAHKGTEHGA